MMPNGSSPASRVLKFCPTYTKGDAYNALSDLRALEILMCLFGQFPNQNLMLWTSDKNLALFWVGLNASNFAFRDGRWYFKVAPTELLPGITEKQWQDIRPR